VTPHGSVNKKGNTDEVSNQKDEVKQQHIRHIRSQVIALPSNSNGTGQD
jgi:hypothetical protein